jgi:ribosomal protein L18
MLRGSVNRITLATSILLHLGALGCATPRESPEPPIARPRASTTSQPAASAEGEDANLVEPADSLDRLAGSAVSLGTASEPERCPTTIAALDELANAIAPQSAADAAAIRAHARSLETTTSSSAAVSAAAKEGLLVALRALERAAAPPGRGREYALAVETLRSTVAALAEGAPPAERQAAEAAAFRAASDVLALARGGEPVFGEAENESAPPSASVSRESRLEEARADVLKLGQTRWVNARLASARALESLANLLEVQAAGGEAKRSIATLRAQVERLEKNGSSRFGDAGLIKTGLLAALAALDGLDPALEQLLTPWTRAARRAVSGIEDRDSLAFQRATIQDAFRTTVDAFTFAAQASQLPR